MPVRLLAVLLIAFLTPSCALFDLFSSSGDDDEYAVNPPNTLELWEDEVPVDYCTEITAYREAFGVTDVNGNGHPGFSGWTTVEYHINWSTGPIGISSTGGYNCPCNGTVYASINECLPGCHVTLGCFTGICQPVGSVIASTHFASVIVSAEIGLAYFTWNPDDDTPGCFAAHTDWQAKIFRHEREHVRDILDIVEEANAAWAAYTDAVEAVASSQAEAVELLQREIAAMMDDEFRRLNAETRARSDAFHATPDGAPTPDPNCLLCPAPTAPIARPSRHRAVPHSQPSRTAPGAVVTSDRRKPVSTCSARFKALITPSSIHLTTYLAPSAPISGQTHVLTF